jgi:peptidoglycan hydrolase-like amidase
MRRLILAALLLIVIARAQAQNEPNIRIGLTQNAQTVSLRAGTAFTVDSNRTRTAKFTMVVALNPAAAGAVTKADLQYRTIVELDGGKLIVLPRNEKVRVDPPGDVPIEFDNHTYRGVVEVFGNSRNTFTVVNELPLEQYLLGVVPNELSPVTFGQIEAQKAQAVAARTYAIRNMGQSRNEGYDICATDACQVYQGMGTEHPVSSQAVMETQGVVATYQNQPINAMYTSTCGGRTEDAENIFDEKVPYLVSTSCEYKHPEPAAFTTSRSFADWKDGVLAVAGVSNFSQARRFVGLPGQGEPPSMELGPLATFIRQSFYPTVLTASDESFVTEQGILPPSGPISAKETIFRLIDKKNAFEWQQGVLTSWNGSSMVLNINGLQREFKLAADAPIYQRVGDERLALRQGSWIGGELVDFRAVDNTIQMLVYRINFANPAADRFSRLALWQVHKTRQDLDTAFKPLSVGGIQDMRVIARGPSDRPLRTEIVGSAGRSTVRALRMRTLLGLRDSLFSFDIERNAQGEVLGIMFYGRGWGHGVGMCQVGAFGMALDGASYEQILKKYYKGIELKKLF